MAEHLRPRIPCPAALGAIGVPAKRWVTRADLYAQVSLGRQVLGRGDGSTVADAAKEAAMSPERFLRVFKQMEGMDPSTYAREAALTRAREMLATTDLTIAETAVECGYRSPSAFSRAYKGRFGRSPTEDRREMSDLAQPGPPRRE